ncbi:hypothetical protein FQR65_LT12362 [Abscondita terminalis]|nr:hypothetical protein FQR65_LT12362 [Abscondita terminalis]
MRSTLLKETIRRCSTRAISGKPRSWYLMGTAEDDGLIKNNLKKFLSDGNYSTIKITVKLFKYFAGLINAQKSYYAQYVSEAAAFIQDDHFLSTVKRFEEFSHYNGPNRDLYCAWMMLAAYQLFEKPENLTEYNIKKVCMMSWAFEAMCTGLLLFDDCMDHGKIRYKKECWYRKPEIGNTAITDVHLLRMTAYRILAKYFRNEPNYNLLIGEFTNAVEGFVLGQTIDNEISKKFRQYRNLNCYTLNKYHRMCFYKSYVPVVRANTLSVLVLLNAQEEYYKYEYIFLKIGNHCQIENDVRDCFNNYESFGRYGSDIREGKLSWALATALEHANEEEKFLIKENYARDEPECHKIVTDIYKKIDILEKYYNYKNNLLEELRNDYKNVSNQKIIDYIENYINFYIDVDSDFEKK